jgi:hypothetical protein
VKEAKLLPITEDTRFVDSTGITGVKVTAINSGYALDDGERRK